ncbi:LOW QUALITY PROTEIN: OTU domain-containing protein 4-like [Leucoraja erinacea]|uniref:LOW QUALITY PROTEIN: OTU domain-containing protein 4-like n=1 Tax=Leucoraja erinaceus TaxID=7782 RepID=UPI002454ECCD|nr:LOW QUALITY PROTEIN: OTU domain-containing protein 4-like [Leucoraja erinacea]
MDRVGAAGQGEDGEAVERSNPSSPGEVLLDAFLKNQGLYRKRIAKDGSCLFRAVAEQVFHTQSEHLEVRGACVSYLRRNQEQFEAFIEGSFDEYLKQLEKPQEWVGQVEISALSLMYKRDFIIYQEPNRPPARVTENGFPDTISLCFSNGNHYDSVYPRKFVDAAALCQSILYEMLYQDVLKTDVEPVISALDANGKTNEHVHSSEDSDSGAEMELHRGKAADESDMSGFKSQSCNKVRKKQRKKSENAAQNPFPGEVLRAFNPNVYRNIEYEVWQKSKQAQQERDYSIAAGMQYVVGDKCKVCLDNGKYYNAHIQAISPDNGPVDVYIEELGEKHSALLQDLRPLTQGCQRATWSRAQGKRAKKPMNANSEADFRGVKNSSSFVSRPNRFHSSLPPRLHQARQLNSTLQNPEQQPKVPSLEYLERMDDFPQLSKKYDRRLESNQTKVANKDVSPPVKVDPGPNEAHVSTNTTLRVEKSLPALDNPLEKTPSPTRTEQVDPILQELQTQSSSSPATSENPPVVPVHLPSPPAGNSSQTTIPPVTPSSVVTSGPAVSQAPMSSVPMKPLRAPFPGPNLPLMSAPQLPIPYDLLYPGFALNERGESAPSAPTHSYDKSGADLPEDKSILRFFYNLGVKAYSLPWWPPHSYLYPLTQAYLKNCGMYPGCHAPIFPANPQFQPMAGRVQNDNAGGPLQTSNPQFQAMAGRVQNDNVGAPLQTANPQEINALPQSDVGDDSNHSLSSQSTTRQLPHKNNSVSVSANPGLPPQNFNPHFPSHFPHFLSDGAQLSGWPAPPPSSLITQNPYMHAFSFHPMYMTAPGQVYPIQINGGTSACMVDQKIGAPDQCAQLSDNAASLKLEEAERPPLEFSQAGECRLSQVQSVKDPQLVTETVGSVVDLCPPGSEQQSAPDPQEECVNQNPVLGEMKPEKASLISSAGLYSEDTRNIQPQDCASHSEIDSQFSEAKSNSDLASQSAEESKVDTVKQSVADTSTNKKSRNNYKTPDTLCNKHAQIPKRTRGMNYNIKDSPSENNALRGTPYFHRKGDREMNRKDKSGKQWPRDASHLHDSNIDRTSQAVSKGESKPPTKDRFVEHISFGGHENLRIKVENRRHDMSENAPCEETYLVNRSDGDAKQFQNQVVVEDASGITHEGKRSSYRKQKYKDSGKSNTYPRK